MSRLFSSAISMHSNSVYCRCAGRVNVPATSRHVRIVIVFMLAFFFFDDFGPADLVVCFYSTGDFNTDSVGQADGHGLPLELLGFFVFHEVHERGVAAEFHGTLGDGDHVFATVQDDIGIGTVAGTDKHAIGQLQGGLHLEQDGTALFYSLGRDVLERGGNNEPLDSTDGDLHGHAHGELPHFRFVDLAHEEHVAEVGYRGNGGAVVEVVGLDHRVARLYRYVEDGAGHGGTYQGVTGLCRALGDPGADEAQVVGGGAQLLLVVVVLQLHPFELFTRYHLVLVELPVALVVDTALVGRQLCPLYTGFGTAQIHHVGHYLYPRDDVARLYRLARLLEYLGHDARELGLDKDLVARVDLSCGHGSFLDVSHRGGLDMVSHRLGTRFLPQKHEGG